MKIVGRSAPFYMRSVVCWLAVVCAAGLPMARAAADPPASANASGSAAAIIVPATVHGIIQLDGPWRFQMGDDPRWSDPSFDDSNWPAVTLGKTLSEQGFETYAGYAWYRLRVQPEQFRFGALAGSAPLHLLVTSHSVGQLAVYINGVEVGRSRGMTDKPVDVRVSAV